MDQVLLNRRGIDVGEHRVSLHSANLAKCGVDLTVRGMGTFVSDATDLGTFKRSCPEFANQTLWRSAMRNNKS